MDSPRFGGLDCVGVWGYGRSCSVAITSLLINKLAGESPSLNDKLHYRFLFACTGFQYL
jgi:hypothetical protein